ncbi:MAG: lipoyl(octanoyl) transferase LipB [Ignavibacteria bacterium]|nr:lipoyl(octanoyl) transferase LipB [Ignavibacteria bacterium]MCC7158340.1 lipoyl(octanoyl) transferase LipB [Ignavibacteria bacterium]
MKAYHINLGKADYKEVWDLQKKIHLFKQKNYIDDVILTVEHNHVYTLGKTGDRDHILISDDEMKSRGISYYEIDRGGDITYHGPGQLVVYPIFDLNNHYKDTHRFLRELEEVVIQTLAEFNITAHREDEYTGVWVGEEKICAIGIKVSKWITMHGLALNVNSDLSYFEKIIPCGIFHKGVTGIKNILGSDLPIDTVNSNIINSIKKVFGFGSITEVPRTELEKLIRI